MTPGRILLAEDDESILTGLTEILRTEGYEVEAVARGDLAIAQVEASNFDLLITDLHLPGADGVTVLRRTREISPQTLGMIFTGDGSVDSAIAALRQGAHDYILKPLVFDDVLRKVERLLGYRQLAWTTQILRRQVDSRFDFNQMITGRNPRMLALVALIKKVAQVSSTVLITGESGVGKEVIARAVHQFSQRAEALFLPINSSAIPENLLESQLFGHAKGAFSGAVTANEGLFQRARGGTIFLDEIGELPLSMQAKILRTMQHKEVLPLGTTNPIRVDVRILAATNKNLKKEVAEGRFREDLFYRLSVISVEVPPLRERREDVPELLEFLVRRFNLEMNRRVKGVDHASMKLLMAQPWKGNIRELENVIEHAMIVGEGEWITVADLPLELQQAAPNPLPSVADDLREAMRGYEKLHIESILRRADFDKRMAAELLGVSLSSLYRKLEEHGIAQPEN